MCISSYIYIHILMYICKETYYKELAHMIMEANKSQHLQSASWWPRRANGVVAVRLGRKAWEPGKLTVCVTYTARLRASRLYTLQEAVFQFKSEGRLNWCRSSKAGGISPYSEEGQSFSFSLGLQLIAESLLTLWRAICMLWFTVYPFKC